MSEENKNPKKEQDSGKNIQPVRPKREALGDSQDKMDDLRKGSEIPPRVPKPPKKD